MSNQTVATETTYAAFHGDDRSPSGWCGHLHETIEGADACAQKQGRGAVAAGGLNLWRTYTATENAAGRVIRGAFVREG